MKRKKRDSADGIRFECKAGCTDCCKIPGLVFVHKDEIPGMAGFFGVTAEEFEKTRLAPYFGDIFRFSFPQEEPCIYLTDEGCSIYPVRPIQCRTFPFWPDNMKKPENWEQVMNLCPGVGKGRLHSMDEITKVALEASKLYFL